MNTQLPQAGQAQQQFLRVRKQSLQLVETLETEDFGVQSMPEASPVKWNLAHTTWFFESFILQSFQKNYQPVHPLYALLFNSYYWAKGERWPRQERGLLSRPTVAQVMEYRQRIDERMQDFLVDVADEHRNEIFRRLEIGTHHEQQHQELLLMDLKHALSLNPMQPVYRDREDTQGRQAPELRWLAIDSGLQRVGYTESGFHYDNEAPAHLVHVPGFELANRCVTNGEWLEWMQAGGYENPAPWMMDGWAHCSAGGWQAPLYWQQQDGAWFHFTLSGLKRIDEQAPVMHISWFEADAMARWAGLHLPNEFQWEAAAADASLAGNYLESGHLRPLTPAPAPGLRCVGTHLERLCTVPWLPRRRRRAW